MYTNIYPSLSLSLPIHIPFSYIRPRGAPSQDTGVAHAITIGSSQQGEKFSENRRQAVWLHDFWRDISICFWLHISSIYKLNKQIDK